MELMTKVELPVKSIEINHYDKIVMMGSCFADNIGDKLLENKFVCDKNPFGVLYNPMSISVALNQLIDKKVYSDEDIMESQGIWFSLMHHSSFSSRDKNQCLYKINERLMTGADSIRNADWLILTFGTARVYKFISDGRIVGNCHKLNAKLFTRLLLEPDDIIINYVSLISKLREINPKLKIIFTVSPIRHAKDGMHGNQLSKSVLLLSVDKICSECDGCYYFPSYEIMMDELRDYRFYADDMLHPSSSAVNYIWEKFSNTYFGKDTFNVINMYKEINQALLHKPFDPESEAYQKFLSQIMLKIETLKEKFPYLDVEKEINLCQTRLMK